jgi:hypothetical protein
VAFIAGKLPGALSGAEGNLPAAEIASGNIQSLMISFLAVFFR